MRPPTERQRPVVDNREHPSWDDEAHRRRYGFDVIECPRCGRMTRVPGGWTGPCMDCETLKGALL